ncbi:hypothetical protein CCACVL1_02997 [Corchorus capsularis]|uniref:Uncharacterized protein n=1 Tax=Corchorus capsularis TaxID=210143 RepID=A0A1R3K481_COCAP|nr:hypothetical protein CCACVL1_02997 [Corchorus capsularis]
MAAFVPDKRRDSNWTIADSGVWVEKA